MKKTLFILLIILFIPFSLIQIYCQTNPSTVINNPSKWFSSKQINNNIWLINDHGLANIYLIIGKDSVMIIDTGNGVDNLKDYVKYIVDLPVIVVNTHGHGDHAGGNDQFEKVYLHPDDFDIAKEPRDPKRTENFMRNFLPPGEPLPAVKEFNKHAKLIPIRDGHLFNLGKRKVEVIAVPGHTKGSICLLDKSSGVLITGDNNNSQTWLFKKECTPLDVYKKSLEKLHKRKKQFTLLLPGHGDPYDTDFIDENLTCVNNILTGQCETKDFTTFAGSGKLGVYKRASIIFDPSHLK